jgi:sugar lactone lactonase YvrE
VVDRPADVEGSEPQRVITGLASAAGPDGSFATGSDGAVLTDEPGEALIVETWSPAIPPDAVFPGSDQFGYLLVGSTDDNSVFPYANIAAAEQAQNPDGAQIDSNPYGVLYRGDRNEGTSQALIADAAANTVWLVTPDFDNLDENGAPAYEITVFATWATPPDDEETPEYVPTSLAADRDGNIYVGGLGSFAPGQATISKFSADGEPLQQWTGFTAITGLAVDRDGSTLYVSQLQGTPLPPVPDGEPTDPAPPAGPPGNVLKVNIEDGTFQSQDVPFPAGLAVDSEGSVYVSAFSVSDADGTVESEQGPALPAGQVWKIQFPWSNLGARLLPVFGSPPLADTGGEWVPLPATEPFPIEVCGTTLTVRDGDIYELERRVTVNGEGIRDRVRGNSTADFLDPDGRVVLDEVNTSGDGSVYFRPDGTLDRVDATGGFWFTTPDEQAAIDAAGLPDFFAITSNIDAQYSEDGLTLVSISLAEPPTDLCQQLAT